MNLEKLVQRRPTSSHRRIAIMTQRKALQTLILKMENCENAGFTAVYTGARGDYESSRIPTAPVKLAAMIQERGASAQCTQADHSTRESLMSSSSQEPRAYGKLAVMFSLGTEKPGNQLKNSIFKFADISYERKTLFGTLRSEVRTKWMKFQCKN